MVWRCVNRIEYGTKFCGSSPSIPEEELHRAIVKAVQDLAVNFTEEVAAQINGILHDIQKPAKSQSPICRNNWSRPGRSLTDCWKCPGLR
ncbi:MAG: recombinase zinc beta ribbon domain-containing protein [Faecalibacterium prausnitzii]